MECDNFLPVVPVDERLHKLEKPFCYDPTCPCHEDELLIGEVAEFVRSGLLSPDEATDFVTGRGI